MSHEVLLASAGSHRGPAYFFTVGIVLVVFFAPFVVAPNGLRRLNGWLSKSRTIRALARARSGSDSGTQYASDTRIRVVSAVATVVGLAFLVIGFVKTGS